MSLLDCEFWHQLSPNIQKSLADVIYGDFYRKFRCFFEGTEKAFRRRIALNTKYCGFSKFTQKNYIDPDIPQSVNLIIQGGKEAEAVYFILTG